MLEPIGWSSDGGSIYATESIGQASAVSIIPVDGGQPTELLPLPANVPGSGHLFPNINTVGTDTHRDRLVHVSSQHRSDVWLVENFDHSPKPLD